MAWVGVLGGLGLFLLGMAFLTESLEAALGAKVKAIMRRLTRNRVAAFGTGAVVTAVIQSSSATSLITIGLVGAGLITLSQAIGVLIGANVGTTATAYLVSLVGLKFSVSIVALPFVGVGGLARVFLRGKGRIVADLLLGFGLLFVGIDFMQSGMADVASTIDLSRFAEPGILAGLVLVLIGIALTAMMQSSSAAMAATLTALAGGAIDIRMGAFLVVGQNIGTTVTALIGAIGGSVNARRTAGAHVAFNVGTGVVALITLPLLLAAAQRVAGGDGAFALSVFHTFFNVLGAVLFLPLTGVLARALQKAMPSEADALTSHLDRSALRVAASSSEAVRQTLAAILLEEARLVDARLAKGGHGRGFDRRMRELREAMETTQDYIQEARASGWQGYSVGAAMRSLDHIRNIASDLAERAPLHRFQMASKAQAFVDAYRSHREQIAAVLDGSLEVEPLLDGLDGLTRLRKTIRSTALKELGEAQAGDFRGAQADLDALHWLDRIAWHLRRALHGWAQMGNGDRSEHDATDPSSGTPAE